MFKFLLFSIQELGYPLEYCKQKKHFIYTQYLNIYTSEIFHVNYYLKHAVYNNNTKCILLSQ